MSTVKKILAVWLCVFMLASMFVGCGPIILSQHATTDDGLLLELIDRESGYQVVGYNGDSPSLQIPSEYQGLPITRIEKEAFAGCAELTSITIPNNVTSIGCGAFAGCTNLTCITLPFVTSHFGYIFGAPSAIDNPDYVPPSLNTVVITNAISIDSYAFFQCSGLMNIHGNEEIDQPQGGKAT